MKQFICAAVIGLASLTANPAEAKVESWYFYPISIGAGKAGYQGAIQDSINQVKAVPGVSNMALGIDLLGFYFPLGTKSIFGFCMNALRDSYTVGLENLAIQQNQYSLSYMGFLGHEIGSGFFVRADAGISVVSVSYTGTSASITANSSSAFGWLAGGGYGIPVSEETRLLLNANYSYRKVEGLNYSAAAVTLGILL